MDVREKLVELLGVITCSNTICNFCEHFQNKSACERHKKEVIADHLITNGVTVQEWISVKDRLPEIPEGCAESPEPVLYMMKNTKPFTQAIMVKVACGKISISDNMQIVAME